MPLANFTSAFKPQTSTDFPKLKLEKDERVRLACLESPTYAYVHTLRAPRIVNGEAITEIKERGNGDDKTQYEAFVMDFIGRPLCLGDDGIIADKGLDVQNCPVCAAAQKSGVVDAPARRFAMNVIKYKIKPGSQWEVSSPFSVETLVWAFTETVFGKLFDLVHDPELGPIDEYDLRLGPCISAQFQQYPIQGSKTLIWKTNAKTIETTQETYENNKASNLESFCGRKVDRKFMEQDLETINYRWDIANGKSTGSRDLDEKEIASLSEGLELLKSDNGKAKESDEVDLSIFASDETAKEDIDDFSSLAKDLGL